MASWLTSKLKVAETLLDQIDKQAADSLRKQENGESELKESSLSREDDLPWIPEAPEIQKPEIEYYTDHNIARKENAGPRKLQAKRVGSKTSLKDKSQVSTGTEASHGTEEKLNFDDEICIVDGDVESGAVEAANATIAKREAFVAKLEMEKQSLESLLSQQEEQKIKEAAELRTGMLELMEAVELEKQRHANSRMEALARESFLENENAELAKELAAAQRKLDKELTRLLDARVRADLKQANVTKLQRGIQNVQKALRNPPKHHDVYLSLRDEASELRCEVERCKTEFQELQQAALAAKARQMVPSEKEQELESRLAQLTDHLIQKQALVEALSIEKSTLVFRLETMSKAPRERLLTSSSPDIEIGRCSTTDNRFGHLLGGRAGQILGVLGVSRTARNLAAVYLLVLHGWVLFVIIGHLL